MVNRGPSRGCITCRKRRVKCDETKPACARCFRVGRECAGYGRQPIRVRFRDESSRYLNRPSDPTTAKTANPEDPKHTSRSTHVVVSRHHGSPIDLAIPASLQPKHQDVAVAFFLTYVTDIGRNLESTRGFLEFVRPVLFDSAPNSALSVAVTATAVKLWAFLSPSDVSASFPIELHNRALVRLQKALSSPVEQSKDATVLAALMLQQIDTLAAVFGHHEAHSTHREGALALLTQRGGNIGDFKYHGHLLGNLFHSKISFCVRHKIALTVSESDWLRSEVLPTLPSNPSSVLDVIGISISKLQRTFDEFKSSREVIVLGALQHLLAIIKDVDTQLGAWLNTVPDIWHSVSRHRNLDFIPTSVVTYHGSCDIYPSIQIADIWNTWRIYRLIVAHIKTELAHRSLVVSDAEIMALSRTPTQHLLEIQNLAESICQSIPFYLGNCSKPVSFSDINNSELVFPSYHDLPPTDKALLNYKNSDHYASRVDHYRHVVLHGPLHALSILSSLIALFFEEQGEVSANSVHERQKQWIYDQFHRSLYLLRFIPCDSQHMHEPHLLGSLDNVPKTSPLAVSAQSIHQALSTVNII